ncbi:MAG: GTP cyclohydrolase I FolE [Fibrobacterota bacterium]
MKENFKQILRDIGEDLDREGLRKTPERAAAAMEFLTRGYKMDIDAIVNNALFEAETDDMIIVKDIELYSMCEHHMLPFIGKCHVAYLPGKKIIGLSKIPRIVDCFARRLQVQEVLTRQIAETIMKYTGASGVGVVIDAQHLCVMMRGVEKQNALMKTSCMLGHFRSSSSTRTEFLNLIGK